MKVIGITGQVGSGKSAVLELLAKKYNCRIIKTDEVAGALRDQPGECHDKVTALLGRECLDAEGNIIRSRMADRIFSDTELLKKINDIIHPYTWQKVRELIKAAKEDYIFVESALLFDGEYADICDETWYIFVSEEIRRHRLRRSRGYSDEKISQILSHQKSEEYFREKATWIIDNSAELDLTIRQIELIL